MEGDAELSVIVIGAGFGGLGAAHALRERGIEDVVVLERADDVGGVWRDNTYPGAACDVPSALYSWSWALNPHWGRRYSQQPEILDYLRTAAERDGLLDLVRTGQEVTSVCFEESIGRWRVTATDLDQPGVRTTYEADLVISAVGQLSNPIVPDLPGADSFAGAAFHSAQWRHDVDLRGRRVAVVGTGASAIQFLPAIVDEVASLVVFQRSAPYVVPKPDTEHHPRHHRLVRRWPSLLRAERSVVFALTEVVNAALEGRRWYAATLMRLLGLTWRLHLRRQVGDRGLRRRLRPDYPIGCKRLLFSDDWYPALGRDHVAVVTDEVVQVEPGGVRVGDGTLHQADVLIWGTGFAATEFLAPMQIIGPGGHDLHETWADGARAHLGMSVAGFPNFFCIYGPNTNLGGSSIIAMMQAQADYIAEIAAGLAAGRARLVSVRAEAADAFDVEIQDRLARSVWAGCTSWYRDGERITTNWPGQVSEYQDRLAEVDWSELEEIG